jgi:ubiquinone/menaquinone biosynthesis C-methylase UbiE
MLKLARKNIERAGFNDRIDVQLVNGRKMPYADGQFSALISNSIIHHIPNPVDCFAEIVRVAAPNATIFLRDLYRPSSIEELDALVAEHAAGANAHQKKLFGDSLHAALTLEEVQSIVQSFGFDPNEVRLTTDRHWTWAKRGES